jgi:hypothetical protein
MFSVVEPMVPKTRQPKWHKYDGQLAMWPVHPTTAVKDVAGSFGSFEGHMEYDGARFSPHGGGVVLRDLGH